MVIVNSIAAQIVGNTKDKNSCFVKYFSIVIGLVYAYALQFAPRLLDSALQLLALAGRFGIALGGFHGADHVRVAVALRQEFRRQAAQTGLVERRAVLRFGRDDRHVQIIILTSKRLEITLQVRLTTAHSI